MRRLLSILVFFFIACISAFSQRLSISTNALDYAAGGTINLEASYGVARHWSVGVDAKYTPFLYRQQSYAAGFRYWPWHVYSGWWMAGKLKYQEFSSKEFWGFKPKEGDRYGASVSAGYSIMLTSHLNLDLGIGFWGGYTTYTVFDCGECGRVLSSGKGIFVLPNDLMLALSVIF